MIISCWQLHSLEYSLSIDWRKQICWKKETRRISQSVWFWPKRFRSCFVDYSHDTNPRSYHLSSFLTLLSLFLWSFCSYIHHDCTCIWYPDSSLKGLSHHMYSFFQQLISHQPFRNNISNTFCCLYVEFGPVSAITMTKLLNMTLPTATKLRCDSYYFWIL